VVQPVSLASERHWLASRLGPERLGRVYAFRDLLDAGVVVAGSSDAPIESPDVVGAMACATDRDGIGPGQALSPLEALALYTTGGAWVRHAEHRVGRIAPGYRADLVELDRDPRDGAVGLEVVATVCAGEDVHRLPREPAPR
jgi:predicted amidohydrolase YtcJ